MIYASGPEDKSESFRKLKEGAIIWQMRKTTATMRDVAKLAGVSVATVSAVINGSATVSEMRAQRVRTAMETLDYHADQIARSLKTGRSNVIGMVIPDITNAFYTEVIVGAEETAARAGLSVILCHANEDPAQEQKQLSTLFSHRVDGVLMACSDSSVAYDRLTRRRFPIIFFDRIPQGVKCGCVATDNFMGGYLAAQHLIALGHQRIALIAGNLEMSTHAHRVAGFKKAMREAQLPNFHEYCNTGRLHIESGYQFGRELLGLSERFTAVFCSNNKMLLGFVRAMNEMRVACPEQVSVVGFDDFAWTEHAHPRLTVVAQPSRELGARAMELLINRIAGEAESQVLLQPELRVRESTAPVSSQQIRNVSFFS